MAATISSAFYCLLQEPGFYPGSCFHHNQPFHSATISGISHFFDSYYSSPSYSYSEGILTTDGGSQYLPIIRPLYSQYNSDELGFIYIWKCRRTSITIPLKTAGTYQNNDFYLTLEDHSYVYSNYTLTDANPSYEITGDLSSLHLSPIRS